MNMPLQLPSMALLAASACLCLPAFAQGDAPAPPTEVAAPADTRDPAALLAEARSLYEQLEYDQVIPLAEGVLAHPGTAVEQRLDAYLLQGSSLAIVGNPIDAEKPFRFLLRGRPEFDMPPDEVLSGDPSKPTGPNET